MANQANPEVGLGTAGIPGQAKHFVQDEPEDCLRNVAHLRSEVAGAMPIPLGSIGRPHSRLDVAAGRAPVDIGDEPENMTISSIVPAPS